MIKFRIGDLVEVLWSHSYDHIEKTAMIMRPNYKDNNSGDSMSDIYIFSSTDNNWCYSQQNLRLLSRMIIS